MDDPGTRARGAEVFWAFLRLGLGFGWRRPPWPQAFRAELADRRGWVSGAEFDEALDLALSLPGARAAHLAMAIGRRIAGYPGLTLAWIGYLAPAGIAAIAVALLFPQLDAYVGEGWRRGLMLAACGLTLRAVIDMARRQAADPLRAGLAIGAAAGLLISRGPIAQIFVLAAGAAFGVALLRRPATAEAPPAPEPRPHDFWTGVAALALFVMLMGGLPFLAGLLGERHLALASVLYRAGALAFGGEHMTLPLVYREVVGRGWLDRETYLAGFGAVQALPGPLSAMGGFTAAAQDLTRGGWAMGLAGLAAILAPGALLTLGLLPFWPLVTGRAELRAAVAGLGAVAVGSVAAALWNPLIVTAVRTPWDWLILAAAWLLPALARVPAWLVVVGLALATGLLTR